MERAYTTAVVGFDSAWADNPKAPGAICAITLRRDGARRLVEPELASFAQALAFIRRVSEQAERCLVALDQPTIVPNVAGCRPVDRVAGALISFLGGGVQPANRSKTAMFGDGAPIWRFKAGLQANEDPERARLSDHGLFLIEVFPAMALPSLEAAYFGRKLGPRYNPVRRKTFRIEHWRGVLAATSRFATAESVGAIALWAKALQALDRPRKADQDRLDSVLCALVGYQWLTKARAESIMIGDLETGYMIAPASPEVRARLSSAASKIGVPVDGSMVGYGPRLSPL